eukprot:8545220-Pyramimonas_sp.AAC.1
MAQVSTPPDRMITRFEASDSSAMDASAEHKFVRHAATIDMSRVIFLIDFTHNDARLLLSSIGSVSASYTCNTYK